jgi:hypothetical protein
VTGVDPPLAENAFNGDVAMAFGVVVDGPNGVVSHHRERTS